VVVPVPSVFARVPKFSKFPIPNCDDPPTFTVLSPIPAVSVVRLNAPEFIIVAVRPAASPIFNRSSVVGGDTIGNTEVQSAAESYRWTRGGTVLGFQSVATDYLPLVPVFQKIATMVPDS